MKSTLTLEQAFRELARGVEPGAIEVALEQVRSHLSDSTINKAAIQEVLESEISGSYFEDSHFKATAAKKLLFDYELSELVCRLLGRAFPPKRFRGPGIIEPLESAVAEDARTHLDKNGFYILPHRLDQATCEEIVRALDDVDFRVKATGEIVRGYQPQNVDRIGGNTCWVDDQQQFLQIPQVQQLASDPTILNLIQDYLGCIPIHDQANCWWSINHRTSRRTMKSDAQLYHQDKDFVRFVKVFVHLNDVTDENGPHTYITGSARDYLQHVPPNYSVGQRLDDDYLQSQYASDRFVTMRGAQGTILLEDTSGFHKGTPVQSGHRLMLQLEYCCSLYGSPGLSFSYDGLTPEYADFAKQHPRMFMNYDDSRYLRYIAKKRKRPLVDRKQIRHKIRLFGEYLRRIGANAGLRKSA